MTPSREGGRLPIPTKEELASISNREIVACSGLRHGPLIALSIGLSNGDIAMVSLDTVGKQVLLAALKALVPDFESYGGSPAKTRETDDGVEVQVGHMPGRSLGMRT